MMKNSPTIVIVAGRCMTGWMSWGNTIVFVRSADEQITDTYPETN
jgi:hypothetical protein